MRTHYSFIITALSVLALTACTTAQPTGSNNLENSSTSMISSTETSISSSNSSIGDTDMQNISSQSHVEASFSLPAYKFAIKYFTSQDCSWTHLGPNDAQRKMDAGEEISGTVLPARDVISFHCASTKVPDFTLGVYEKHNFQASMDGTWDGACGTQFATENIVNRYVAADGQGASYLEVIQKVRTGQQADYCFDVGNKTMITLRWNTSNYVKDLDVMEHIADSVSIGVRTGNK